MQPNKIIANGLRGAPEVPVHAKRKHVRKSADKARRLFDKHVVSLADPDSYEAEQYRKLRYVLEEKRKVGQSLVIAICSPIAGDGKSLTAVNLAGTLAQDSKSGVLLVDVDIRRQSKDLQKNLPCIDTATPGMSNLISGHVTSLADVLQANSPRNLALVSAGTRAVPPYEIFRSPRFANFIEEARRTYDYVILDSPPVVPVSDCRVIAKWVDGFLMVVSAHRTPRAMLEEALNLMGPEKILGIVFNRCDQMPSRYYSYYGYGRPTAKGPADS